MKKEEAKLKRYCNKCSKDITHEEHFRYSADPSGRTWFYYCLKCSRLLVGAKWKYRTKVLPVEIIGLKERIEVQFAGKLMGFRQAGENKEDTKARLIIEAEQRINAKDDIRAHLKGH